MAVEVDIKVPARSGDFHPGHDHRGAAAAPVRRITNYRRLMANICKKYGVQFAAVDAPVRIRSKEFEMVLNASIGSMLATASGLSGQLAIANVANHMAIFRSTRTAVPLPVLLTQIDTGQAQHQPLDGTIDPAVPHPVDAEHAANRHSSWRYGEQERGARRRSIRPIGRPGTLLARHRVQGHKGCDTQE